MKTYEEIELNAQLWISYCIEIFGKVGEVFLPFNGIQFFSSKKLKIFPSDIAFVNVPSKFGGNPMKTDYK